MYHVGYHEGHRPSSIREPPVESPTSITVRHLQQQAVGRLKVELTTPPVPALPRRGRKNVLDVDFGRKQVGAALLQELDDAKL